MAFSSTHVLFRMNGSFGSNAATQTEQWTCGMRINTGTTNNSEAAKTAFLETIAVAANTFHTSTAVSSGNFCWLQSLSCAYIGPDGKYVGGGAQTTATRPYTTPAAGFGTVTTSWDVARVFTLRTAQARGRGHVGRFFYPAAQAVANDGRWTAAEATAAATAAVTFLNQVNSASKSFWTASFGLSVMSFVGDVSYVVNAVEVGRAPDTMRSRTRQLVESPSRGALAGVLTTEEVNASRVWA